MRALSFAAVVFFASSLTGNGQDRQFPYDAVVVEDGVYMRSGNKERFYPTGRLAKGRRVTVHRHDPGGWYMIAPPEGSFSYIPKKYVRIVGNGIGEVSDEGVVAWVGTEFGKEATVFQRRLSVGQQVQVIGEAEIEIDKDRGPETMLKIIPPRREYRWVPGRALVAVDQAGGVRGVDPFQGRTESQPRSAPAGNQFLGDRPVRRRSNGRRDLQMGNNKTTIDPARLNADRARLDELDATFRAIIRRPKSEWDFAELEAGYLQLQQNAAHPALASQVNLRLPALARYKRTKRQYDEFLSLTSATTQRDRELTRMTSGVNVVAPPATEILPAPPGRTDTVTRYGETVPVRPPTLPRAGNGNGGQTLAAPAANLPQTGPIVPEPVAEPSPYPNRKAGPIDPIFDPPPEKPVVKQEPVPPGMTRVPQRHPRFVGAGIIQESTDLDVPKYVLLTPQGKILAYLEGVGDFDLSKHVTYAMGIEGDRFHSDKLKADFIKVRGVAPVALK